MMRLPKWGAILSAAGYSLAWICCVPPIFGAGGAALAVAAGFLGPFRPFLFGLSLLFLGIGVIQTVRRSRCREEGRCSPKAAWRSWISLLLAGIAVAILVTLPWWSSWIIYWFW